MHIDLKTALVFFILGLVQGLILMSWHHDKRDLRLLELDNDKKQAKPKKTLKTA